MEAKNIFDVEKFVVDCNDMLSGKFFDVCKRLEKFLDTMSESEDVLDLLADCLDGFDEEAEFEKAFSLDRKTGAVKVTFPSDDKKRLALTVTIFNDLTNDKLNMNQFLETFFRDNKSTTTQNFLERIIRPFRDVICKYFEISPNVSAMDLKRRLDEARAQMRLEEEEKAEQEENREDELPHLQDLLKEISKCANQILALLQFEKKRTDVVDDVEFVSSAIIKACEQGDLMIVNGLVIGLNYVSKKIKNVRHIVDEMNDLIFDYYEFLAGGAAGDGTEQVSGDDLEEENE